MTKGIELLVKTRWTNLKEAYKTRAKEKSKVLWWNKNARDKQDSIDTEIFREAENVWGYYY